MTATTGVQVARMLATATLRGPDDVARFVSEVPALSADDLLRVVDAVGVAATDAAQHHLRCQVAGRLVERSGDRKLFVPLLQRMRTCEPELRSAIAGALPRVNDPTQHAEACALLRHPDAGVRASASQLLAKIGGKTVLATVGEMMRDRNFQARPVAVEILVRVGGHHAIAALVSALPVATQGEKLKIVRALGDESFMAKDRTGALAAMGELLCDPDPVVLAAATQAFSRLATEEEWFDYAAAALDSKHPGVVVGAVQGLARYPSRRSIESLHRKLRAGPKAVRMEVLTALQAIATHEVLPAVVEALGHRQLDVRAKAAEVLAFLGSSGKVEIARTVLWLLRSRDVEARRMAVEVARKSTDPAGEVWTKLFQYLRDEDWWVRERVADALIEIAGEKLLPYLMGFLSDPAVHIRVFGVEVVRRLGAAAALGALVRTATSDPDWWVRERAIETIAALGDVRAAPWLVDLAQKEPPLRVVALAALAKLRVKEHAPRVAALLSANDPAVRLAALSCLEALDDASQAPHVSALARDNDPQVASLARRIAVGWRVQVELGGGGEGHTALDRLLARGAEREVDDVILVPGRPPAAKGMRGIEFLTEQTLGGDEVRSLIVPILSATQLAELDARRDVDLSYSLRDGTRWRANVFRQQGGLAAVFRVVRNEIPSLDALALADSVKALAGLRNGLVLVGGPTGSGKSTTLAAIVDRINQSASRHVITLEDPIERVHPRRKGLVNQREIGTHATDYPTALRGTMREDPDVILVGELRDHETIAFAITAAETGHLVFGTVHTLSTDTTVDRLLHVFPAEQQDQVRSMLAGSLRGVVCQFLLPRIDQPGRVLACEVLLNNDAVAHLIRTGRTFQLPSVIVTSREAGMQSMDGELLRLYKEGVISEETAWVRARNKRDFDSLLGVESTDDPNTLPRQRTETRERTDAGIRRS